MLSRTGAPIAPGLAAAAPHGAAPRRALRWRLWPGAGGGAARGRAWGLRARLVPAGSSCRSWPAARPPTPRSPRRRTARAAATPAPAAARAHAKSYRLAGSEQARCDGAKPAHKQSQSHRAAQVGRRAASPPPSAERIWSSTRAESVGMNNQGKRRGLAHARALRRAKRRRDAAALIGLVGESLFD